MSRTAILLAVAPLLLLGACASGPRQPQGPRMLMKHTNEKVPDAVKAIETFIERPGCLKAKEVDIIVSRNYEWDVSLTGNEVVRQIHVGNDQHASQAFGNPRAMFRNLDIRAERKITFMKSGFDVVPFIRITARGRAIYIEQKDASGNYKIHEADAIFIHNSEMRFMRGGREEGPKKVAPAVGADTRTALGLR